ncbi:M24 family metallopeptidase [Mesorhizobium sp.]|uniref:M24 family metallopeptidase n=1 Tax=Mesorhizobium sp. TaxID=1871066 RepID=UPI000FE2B128|nr:M24 family metallopeptidase [Mesorhizobium sp.]RWH95469.1 MAG: aminopeptidase P family protein [Mesorhizobium sp.]RWK17695.1 MAG: aminopeptidase P family protein [Mesorhizobium sp.]RWK27600.1 MAG: aminopeptidase P family protein [Mesorhizobium sp.]RWM21407.1 MAG: aminopeptidase P family protein [Mesorhizobium sp.]
MELESLLPDTRIFDFSHVMWEMRQVKSRLELAYHEVAAEICDRAAAAGFDAAQAGINEREVFAIITGEAWRSGADNAQVAVIASGPRSAILHPPAWRPNAGQGGHPACGSGVAFSRLHLTDDAPEISAPTDEQIRTAETMIRTQEEQIRAMRPGADAKEVDGIVREGILAAGLRDSYTNITGYTLGLSCVPRTSDFTRVFLPGSDWQLEQNQVFHMYKSAAGMAFSETIVVTPEGGKRLTKTERKLFC